MTYKEFKNWAEGAGYQPDESKTDIRIRRCDRQVGIVSKLATFMMDTYYNSSINMKNEQREELFCKMSELATTPLEEREEVKKYRLRHKLLGRGTKYNYLNLFEGEYLLSDSFPTEDFKAVFTETELEEIERSYGISLSDFELIEVENDL